MKILQIITLIPHVSVNYLRSSVSSCLYNTVELKTNRAIDKKFSLEKGKQESFLSVFMSTLCPFLCLYGPSLQDKTQFVK